MHGIRNHQISKFCMCSWSIKQTLGERLAFVKPKVESHLIKAVKSDVRFTF
jgi:hypothetical protein